MSPRVACIVVTRDHRELALACLRSLPADLEGVLVDNASTDGTAEAVEAEFPAWTVVREPANTGFSPAVAKGIAMTSAEYVLLVNDDAVLEPGCAAILEDVLDADPGLGSAAPLICFDPARDVINSAGIVCDVLGVAVERLAGEPASAAAHAPHEVWGATGCVALYRRRALDAVGGYDPSFFAYFEDVDVAWRLQMGGWRCLHVPAARVFHRGSATSGDRSHFKHRLTGRNRMKLLARNATTRQLVRWAPLMVLNELAAIGFVVLVERHLAPLHGRVAGLRAWKADRAAGAPWRGPGAGLAKPMGPLAVLRMRSAYGKAAVRAPAAPGAVPPA